MKPTFTVEYTKGADGYVVAECIAIPGCMSQGKTIREARVNIKDAIQSCLEVMIEDRVGPRRKPRRRQTDVVKVAHFRVGSVQLAEV